jgi:iron complex transport system ATP-binding protein
MSAILSARRLDVAIAGKAVVEGLDLDLKPGERMVVLGRNGVGKTTLLHALAGLTKPQAGELALAGQSYSVLGARGAARLRGLLPQHQGDAFDASVLQTVLAGRHPHLSRWAWESAADEAIAQQALAAAGLDGVAPRAIHTLSGGERQRVAIAALLAQAPRLYLLDEPLAHLDLNHQVAVLGLFSRLARDTGVALIMALHDINLAARHADSALLLFGAGHYEFGPAAEMLTAERLGRLYGHPLRELCDGARSWLMPDEVDPAPLPNG